MLESHLDCLSCHSLRNVIFLIKKTTRNKEHLQVHSTTFYSFHYKPKVLHMAPFPAGPHVLAGPPHPSRTPMSPQGPAGGVARAALARILVSY